MSGAEQLAPMRRQTPTVKPISSGKAASKAVRESLTVYEEKSNQRRTQSSTSITGLRKSEKTLICRWNALDETEWAANALPVFKYAEREGTSKQVIWGALRTQLQQSISRELPATVFVSDTLISDINDLNFGWNGNLS
eukprot:7903186-Ditylum_brightwellii.AAC.1